MSIYDQLVRLLPAAVASADCDATTFGALSGRWRFAWEECSQAELGHSMESEPAFSVNAVVRILPGYVAAVADDGNAAEVDYRDAKSGEEAAERYVAGQDADLMHVQTWRVGYIWDSPACEWVKVHIGRGTHFVKPEVTQPLRVGSGGK